MLKTEIPSNQLLESPELPPAGGLDDVDILSDDFYDLMLADDGLQEPPSPRDSYESYFIDREQTAQIREWDGLDPIDEADYTAWVKQLPPDELDVLREARAGVQRQKSLHEQVHDRLMTTVPELYRGELPADLAERLAGKNYALGFNQMLASTKEEAVARLAASNGLDLGDYLFNQRFQLFAKDDWDEDGHLAALECAIDNGYYLTSDIGRFVVAFPVDPEQRQGQSIIEMVSTTEDYLPDDFLHNFQREDGSHHESVNAKYLAGFIDGEGIFWKNNNFARADSPDLVAVRTERRSADIPTQSAGALAVQAAAGSDWL
jgi:hypothetical protein